MESHSNLIDDDESISQLLRETRSIVVLGIKPENREDQPAFYVPKYMLEAGYEIVPLPVYYPEVSVILGRPVHRRLSEIDGPIDMVNVFRMPNDIPQHIDEILAAKPRSVWFQLGIKHDEAARRFAEAGIKVVQDRCLLVEHRALVR